jgi:hypothetical protein
MFTLIYVGWIVSIIGALPLVLGGAMNMMKASVMGDGQEHGARRTRSGCSARVRIYQDRDRGDESSPSDFLRRRNTGNRMDGRSHLGTHPGERPVSRAGHYPHLNLGRVWPSSSRRDA